MALVAVNLITYFFQMGEKEKKIILNRVIDSKKKESLKTMSNKQNYYEKFLIIIFILACFTLIFK